MKYRIALFLFVALALVTGAVLAQGDSGTSAAGLADRTSLFTLYGGTAISALVLGIMNYLGQVSKVVRFIVVAVIALLISIGIAWVLAPDPEVFVRIIITIADTVMIIGSTLGINEVGSSAQNRGGAVASNRSAFDSLFA